MNAANIRFYGELNNFLPWLKHERTFRVFLKRSLTIGIILKSIGMPYREIDLILANGEPVDFTYIVKPGDRISIFPMFQSIDISPLHLINRSLLH
jgi:uncharacterized protein